MKKLKLVKSLFVLFISVITSEQVASQNVLINVLTQQSGIVRKGKTIFLEATINNTDAALHVDVYKLKVQVSVPSDLVTIASEGHSLPTGWTIISNDGATIQLSNGKDMIAATDARTLLIALQGKKTGGPSTVSGQLSFSDGKAPGTALGTLTGENPADNRSTSTIQVKK